MACIFVAVYKYDASRLMASYMLQPHLKKKISEILTERSKISCKYANRSTTMRMKAEKRKGNSVWKIKNPTAPAESCPEPSLMESLLNVCF